MIKKINKTAEITENLKQQGKITILNTVSHVKAITVLNDEMQMVRREYKVKNQNSQNSAALTILTA